VSLKRSSRPNPWPFSPQVTASTCTGEHSHRFNGSGSALPLLLWVWNHTPGGPYWLQSSRTT
jgi:hypothetical protein